MNSGKLIVIGPNFSEEQVKGFTASLVNAPTTLIQRNNDVPVNGSLNVSAGKRWDIGASRFGVIAAAGWDNSWQTKGGLHQLAGGVALGDAGTEVLTPDQDFRFLSTEKRIVMTDLLGRIGRASDMERVGKKV